MRRAAILAALVVLAAGCTRTVRIEETDGAPRPDAGAPDAATPDAGFPPLPEGKCEVVSKVDLLFVIDDSSSMAEEQASLAAELPRLVRRLVSPPDLDGDGSPDWLAITDLHLGVVSTDMGTGGYAVPTCREPDLGQDGVLRTEGNTSIDGCMATYPSFLAGTRDVDPDDLASDFACVATLGTGACGFEQPLEAALKAVTPSTAPTRFAMGTTGHADGENAGFVRPGSLLAIVVLTDEEDCSVADPELFDPSSERYDGDLNLRCVRHPEAIHPVQRYVEGFRRVRSDRPDLFAFSVIAGVPPDLVPDPTEPDFDRILADERMEERIDPSGRTLVPSCDVPGRGRAFPPRRLVRLAREVGGRSAVTSICEADLGPAVEGIASLVGRRACETYE